MKRTFMLALMCIFWMACSDDPSDDSTDTSEKPSDTNPTIDAGTPTDTVMAVATDTTPAATPTDTAVPTDTEVAPTITTVMEWNFDADVEGFALGTIDPDTMTPELTWDDTEGDPDPGALKLSIPFDGTLQKTSVQRTLDEAIDMTGQALLMRIKLTEGLGTDDAPGGAKIYVLSGDPEAPVYADAGWVNLTTTGGWITLTLLADEPGGHTDETSGTYSASSIVGVGVEVATGEEGEYSPATVFVDSVKVVSGIVSSPNEPPWTFDINDEGWSLITMEPDTLTGSMTWTGDNGDPDPGALQLTVDFTAAGDKAAVARSLPQAIDLTGKIITAKVELVSGLHGDNVDMPGGAKIFIKVGDDYVWANGMYQNLSIGSSVYVDLYVDEPEYLVDEALDEEGYPNELYATDDVREIGVEIACSGTEGATCETTTVIIDSITIEE